MAENRRINGSWGWFGLAAYVAVWDALAVKGKTETLSSAFWRGVTSSKHRVWVIPLWSALTAHLFHLVPKKYDPLRVIVERVATSWK